MTDLVEREYLGRSAAGNRVGIYVERRDWDERYFVGKDAELPCAMRRWWTDTTTAWDLLFFHDLGYQTVSTTTAIYAATVNGTNLWNNYTVHRHKWNLHIRGCAFYRDPDTLTTQGVLDMLTDTVVPWPEGRTWEPIVNSPHFEFAPKGVR